MNFNTESSRHVTPESPHWHVTHGRPNGPEIERETYPDYEDGLDAVDGIREALEESAFALVSEQIGEDGALYLFRHIDDGEIVVRVFPCSELDSSLDVYVHDTRETEWQ